jgi:hypothetical protein
MIEMAAQAVVLLAALYFVALGAVALLSPGHASRFLTGFAGTRARHYTEMAARLAVGGSLLVVAPHTECSGAFSLFGWVLVISSAVLTFVPWRVHHRFAQASVSRAARYLPLIGVASLVLGVGLFVLTLRATGS